VSLDQPIWAAASNNWKSALDGAFQEAPWKARVADLRLATNAATVQYGV
jgi:hypothetical protein